MLSFQEYLAGTPKAKTVMMWILQVAGPIQ